MQALLENLKALLIKLRDLLIQQENYIPLVPPVSPTPPEPPKPSTEWAVAPASEKLELITTAREICKEIGLSAQLTQELIYTVQGESGWNSHCININTNGSGDYGIAQLNSDYYLVYNNMTPQEALDNPEKCLRIMAQAFKNGRSIDWIAHQHISRWTGYTDTDLINFVPKVGATKYKYE